MIGTFDLNFEKMLIKDRAKELYEELKEDADKRFLERDWYINTFVNELIRLNKE